MKPRTWPAEEIKSLILSYESLPELWQVSNPDYKNRVKKSTAVDSLAEQFNTTAFEINRKLHNLRTQFNNELRKLRKKGTDENCGSNWEYFTSLKFLMPNIIPGNDTQGDLNSSFTNNILESPESTSVNTKSSRRISKKRKNEDESLDRTLNVSDKLDDAATFGDFVAAAIRNMRSDARKRELKRKIQRIILDIEEKDEADQYSVASVSPESCASSIFIKNSRKSRQRRFDSWQ
ncbi:PREDICTED: uncharacterized protein LOC106121578 [Papilio xuthus]|uniref:Uncharacterized protein LOC106121578 n=1 Tax=Papilio xuthus TaxID=66420 RepID=A0AAJ6ZHV7_PAPXU|nr:PREDICTED: uncharacterized protein LOC106121578 [Papilio xuthus]